MGRWADLFARILRGDAPPPPVASLVGFSLVSASPGRAVFAMGTAYVSALADGESMTTLELKMNFLRPVRQGRLTAVADVIKQGQRVGLVECTITDEQGRLVARASSTCLTLPTGGGGGVAPPEEEGA